ncbi:hypothetical protein [Crocosphaera sp. Alani8]|uniref:hypothetical protein n=1 Tax=Crocosphaera sp. Alani8 TaxID=3038952 RepID=UPI00313DFA3F
MTQFTLEQSNSALQPYPKAEHFGKIPHTFHPHTNTCDRSLQQQQHNPIEVAVTLCSHELEIDEDGVICPKQERVISLVVPEFTRKAVIKAFEQFKQQFLGFYILDFNHCCPNAEF